MGQSEFFLPCEREAEDAAIEYQRDMMARRELANEAVKAALAKHRWWGFTSLLSSFRIWLTGVKFRLGMKLWP